MAAVKSQEVPKAKSLSRQMDRADVIHHQIKNGETLSFLGQAYFGREKQGAVQIARANRLELHSKLKPGKILRIVNPVNFPSAGELNDQLKDFEKSARDTDSKESQSPVFTVRDISFR